MNLIDRSPFIIVEAQNEKSDTQYTMIEDTSMKQIDLTASKNNLAKHSTT
jgi:hypothetical protein